MFNSGPGSEAGPRARKRHFEWLLVARSMKVDVVLHPANVTRTACLGESGVERKPRDAGVRGSR